MGKAKAKAAAGASPSLNPAPSPGADTTAPPASPGASTSPAATPAQPDWTQAFKAGADRNAADASSITSTLKPATPPPPANPDMGTLLAQKAAESMPVNPKAVDPVTGKPKYRMGIGGRIAGSLANFASGMAGRGPVVYVGPGAVNNQYRIDEDMRQKRLAGISQQLADQQALQEENRKQYDTYTQAQDRAAQAQERLSKVDTNEANANKSNSWEDVQNRRLDVQEDKNKADADYKQKLLAARNNPKTYEQTVVAWALETDPAKKTALEQAMLKMQKTEPKKYGGMGWGLKDVQVRGMTANQAREFDRDPTVIAERGKLGALKQWYGLLPEGSAEKKKIAEQMEVSRGKIKQVFDRVKGAKPQPANGSDGGNTQKTVTRAQVQAQADKFKVSYDMAKSQFEGRGYKVK
jgi:hypothetical protein